MTTIEYIKQLELLVQAYRTDYELCILCGGDFDAKRDKEAKEAMMCSDCADRAKEGDQLQLKELKCHSRWTRRASST